MILSLPLKEARLSMCPSSKISTLVSYVLGSVPVTPSNARHLRSNTTDFAWQQRKLEEEAGSSQLMSGGWWLFPCVRGFLENVLSFISRLRFFFLLFFFKVEISSRTLIPLCMPGSVNSGSAS